MTRGYPELERLGSVGMNLRLARTKRIADVGQEVRSKPKSEQRRSRLRSLESNSRCAISISS
jgi:hypothetical protein